MLADLFDYPGKIVAAVLVFGGLFMCRTSRPKGESYAERERRITLARTA
jgi:hypothetical protein